MLPIINYTPEGESWMGTVSARWSQAKRHALGFSDLSYLFMMLPLIFRQSFQRGDMSSFWGLFAKSLSYVIRLVNSHVILGLLPVYMLIPFGLNVTMQLATGDGEVFQELYLRTTTLFWCSTVVSMLAMLASSANFV